VRLFVAVWPPRDVGSALQQLPRPAVGGLRWTAPEQHHVTLDFLGEVADPRVAALAAALVDWARPERPVVAVAGPVTRRLGRGVLCVPVEGLEAMAAGVRAVATQFGLPRDDRPFSGHLTLARTGRRGRLPDELVGSAVVARWEVREVRLVASIAGPSGPRYEPLVLAPLAG